MKTWAAFVLIPVILLLGACEKHQVAELQKVDPGALASPAPGH